MGFAILHLLPFFALLSLFFWSKRLFVLQIVQFSRTWCSNHFVSYFEIQILHVSKFFNDFRGNRNLQKMRKNEKEERKEAQTKQRTKNEKPMRPSFLHASAILLSSVLVHLCVVNSTVNEWSDSVVVCATIVRVAKSRRQENRPIVLLRPGHEVRGIPAVQSCKKRCFLKLYFSEALSWPSMALNDCLFFFSFLERHSRCLMMGLSGVGTGKSPDWSDFHPCRSRQSLAIALGQSSWPELRKGDIQKEQSISRWRKMLVWIIARMERRAFVFKKKKEKKKSASPGSDLRGPVAGCIDGWAMFRHWSTERSPVTKVDPNQTSTPFTESTQESNSSLSSYFFLLSSRLISKINK